LLLGSCKHAAGTVSPEYIWQGIFALIRLAFKSETMSGGFCRGDLPLVFIIAVNAGEVNGDSTALLV
jgi:hypothetical protein